MRQTTSANTFNHLLVLSASVVLMIVSVGCRGPRSDQPASARTELDRRSYNLGVIAAFAEMVDMQVKKLALSSPMLPGEMDQLREQAQRIASENHVEIYRETDFPVTDLFAEELTDGKHVLVIFKGTGEEYLQLKADRTRLLQSGQYAGKARSDIARRLGALLSYPESRIEEMLRTRVQGDATRGD
jgi:hypothetical protein